MYVENFRNWDVYDRSLDLCFAIYCFIEEHEKRLGNNGVARILKIATRIPAKIASAIGQRNIKTRFRWLNEAKAELLNFKSIITELLKKPGIKHEDGHEIDYYYDQVIRLLNAYFGWMCKRNIKQ